MHHTFVVFPFAAIVGQERMKQALLINAVDPSIGGVIIKGDKGTGKSTAVRALASITPKMKIVAHCPFNCDPENVRLMCTACRGRFEGGEQLPWQEKAMEVVDMPLSATEDMVVGSIDIKRVLTDGVKALEPGILARANRNILYIDEVNLLDDHLTNILLDAAAMGINIIEREGISLCHPARFILVGTMNPEEGNVRPQMLDRFGLCVEVQASNRKAERLEIIKRRKHYDRDACLFDETYKERQGQLQRQIINAQQLRSAITITPDLLEKIATITGSLGIKTHRADIVIEKTSCALAAFEGRSSVCEDDIIDAALLALPHRMQQHPFEQGASLERETIQQLIHLPSDDVPEPLMRDGMLKQDIFPINLQAKARGNAAKRDNDRSGLYIRARADQDAAPIAVDATIRKTIRETGTLSVSHEHFMQKIRHGRAEALAILVLDASTSMKIEKKIRLAKSLSWHLLTQSYQHKNRVALISCRGANASIEAQPTRDHQRIERALERMPVGGKTPLTPALFTAWEMAQREKEAAVIIILISDGKGNVFLKESMEEDLNRLLAVWKEIPLLVVNAETKHKSIGVLEDIARRFKAEHAYLEDLL